YVFWTNFRRRFPSKTANVVMLGDSLTEQANWSALFPDVDIDNQGIRGDSTEGALRRLDILHHANPRIVFMLFGINDIRRHISTETTLANYAKLVDAAKPAKVYVQSTLLTTNAREHASVLAINEGLRALCQPVRCTYI